MQALLWVASGPLTSVVVACCSRVCPAVSFCFCLGVDLDLPRGQQGAMQRVLVRRPQIATNPPTAADVVRPLGKQQWPAQRQTGRDRGSKGEAESLTVLYLVLVATGNLHESSAEAAAVALSFLRAHGEWVDERFGFSTDPRRWEGEAVMRNTRTSSGVISWVC